ncbi:hypothetical protein ACFFQW_32560 [Umezawaea endophytica]|uniref:Uncharacterized protein n=1 Tax=Umezawaea endophytica TaxID=1654476 RepID=A0A9X2VWW3_9PSEU|nr:hypothetical protein [Umezawaea endophytica]MCS7483882.1 hypothetical protein [Umezawaea endophytica]
MFVEEVSNTEIREEYGFTIDKKVRDRLVGSGYISAYKSKELRGAFVHELTEAGWKQSREELAAPTPPGVQKVYRLLYGVLRTLDRHMTRSKLEVADVFLPHRSAKVVEAPRDADPDADIRAAYDELVSRPGAWVSLTRLRAALPHLSRDEVDDALVRLNLEPWAYLIPEANQKTLSEADREAAVHVGGEDKHLLSIELD